MTNNSATEAAAGKAAYPNIRKACLEIAYDNGAVNRDRPEKQVRAEIDGFLSSRPYSDHFAAIDVWLAALSDDDLETVCAGEQTEREKLMECAPAFTDQLLSEYFDEVC